MYGCWTSGHIVLLPLTVISGGLSDIHQDQNIENERLPVEWAWKGKTKGAPCFLPGKYSRPQSPTLVSRKIQCRKAKQSKEEQGKGTERLGCPVLGLAQV